MSPPAPRTPSLRVGALLGGVVLLALYVRIGDFLGYEAAYGDHGGRFGGPMAFLYVAGSEYRFWLAHLVLGIPAALLVAHGLSPVLGPVLARLAKRVDEATPRTWRIAGAVFFLVLVAWAVIGRSLVLQGLALTDDENAVDFGARMIAGGHLAVADLPRGLTDLFTYHRDGMVSAVDFPGVLLFGAAATVTKLGSVLYAIASGITGLAVASAAGRWLGPRGRALAAAMWLASPMVGALSWTTHGHLPSRMLIALALAFVARLDTGSPSIRRDAALFGLFAGLAFVCRPFETTALLGPLGVWILVRAVRRGDRLAPILAIAGALPALVVFAWYNARVTGVWFLPARFDQGASQLTPIDRYGPWDRLAFNTGFNALMTAVFLLLVPGVVAMIAGIQRRAAWTVALAVSTAAAFAVGLAHDNTGIHSVGPIHYSEAAVPLVLLAAAGVLRGAGWLARRGLPQQPAAVLLAGYLVIACGLFAVTNAISLRRQTIPRVMLAETLDAASVHDAIVVAPPFIRLLRVDPTIAEVGSWVLQYPHPDPYLGDDRLFVLAGADLAALRARQPDRAVVHVTFSDEPPYIRVTR